MTRRRFSNFARSVAAAALVSACATSWGEQPQTAKPVAQTVGSTRGKSPPPPTLPAGVTALVVVRDAERLRGTAASQALLDLASRFADVSALRESWGSFAQAVGLEPEVAFDRLLGRHAAFVLGEPSGPEEPSTWTVASELTEAAVQRLKQRLAPAPRGFEGGQAVLWVEKGAFELQVPPVDEHGLVHVSLSPSGRSAPINATRPFLEPLAARAALAPYDVLAVIRGMTEASREEAIAIAAKQNRDGWTAKLRATPGMFGLPDAGAWRGVEPPAPLPPADESVLLRFEGSLPELFDEASIQGAKRLMSVMETLRVRMPDADTFDRRKFIELRGLLPSPRAMGGLAPEGGVAAGARREFTFTVAAEVRDVEKAAPQFDEFMLTLLRAARRETDGNEQVKLEGRGEDLSVVRVAVLHGEPQPNPGDPEGDRPPRRSTLSWGFARSAAADDPRGWWIVEFRPGDDAQPVARAAVEQVARRLAVKPPAERCSEIVSLMARPAGLHDLLMGSRSDAIFASMRRLTLVQAELRRDNALTVDGSLEVRVASDVASTPAPVGTPASPPNAPRGAER